MRLLDRVILRCEGNIAQLAPSSQLSWKTLHSVMLGAIESLECLGVSEKARLGKYLYEKCRNKLYIPYPHR